MMKSGLLVVQQQGSRLSLTRVWFLGRELTDSISSHIETMLINNSFSSALSAAPPHFCCCGVGSDIYLAVWGKYGFLMESYIIFFWTNNPFIPTSVTLFSENDHNAKIQLEFDRRLLGFGVQKACAYRIFFKELRVDCVWLMMSNYKDLSIHVS